MAVALAMSIFMMVGLLLATMGVLDHQRHPVGSSRHRLAPKKEDFPMVSRGGETSLEAIFFDRSTPVVVIGFAWGDTPQR